MDANFPLSVNQNTYLRPLSKADVGDLFHLVESNREYLRQFLGWLDHNISEEDTLDFIEKETDKKIRLEALTLGIYFSKKLVGVISVYALDHLNQSASIGYWLSENYQGKGIMTASIEKIVQFSFENAKIHRMEIRCAVHNHKSQKIAEKIGFKKEGILREAISHYGQYFDAYIYSKINKDVS